MSNDLVFQFKCLSGVADLNVHDFVADLTGGASHRSLCPVRTRPIVSLTFFGLLFSLNEFFCCILYFRFLWYIVLLY